VIHFPLPNATVQQEMVAPIVKGTKNVLEACSATSVQKLVVVSTVAAVCLNPSWPQGKIKDESCWSSKELCRGMEVRKIYRIKYYSTMQHRGTLLRGVYISF
jgi:hypothetical protein